ncbi:hypothetical protein KR51_00031180 [Rubidibacter lacunae KORDI 51-2]|uniref:Uncharacterized protein n=1 Tax=Rubidibacter lacunae KORDI 51-2 TaxID=582515 RepID=U5DLI1_9CHRO|nr:hypothetical protein KR51_00031180 [Rubidibacter lacunae KORDI 51-2]
MFADNGPMEFQDGELNHDSFFAAPLEVEPILHRILKSLDKAAVTIPFGEGGNLLG